MCANDEVALGVLTAASDAGLTVPDDVAVTGWDDLMAARFAGLTTVRQPMRELGATAARRLHELIERPGQRSSPGGGKILPTQLVLRTSCGTHTSEVRQDGRRWAVAAVLVAALALTGCGRDADQARTAGRHRRRRPGQGHRRHHGLGDGNRGREARRVRPGLQKENPDAKVNVTAVPWDAAHDKISTAIAGEQTPDVSMIGTTWMGEFAKTGALDPTPAELIDKSAFFPGAWNTTVVDGTSYGVPWYVETRLLYYRKDLAEQGRRQPPTNQLDELKEFATRDEGRRAARSGGSACSRAAPGRGRPSCRSSGSTAADVTDASGNFTLDSPEMTEALELLPVVLHRELAPELVSRARWSRCFVAGRIGAFISGPWHIGILKEQGGADFERSSTVAPMPEDSRRPRSSAAAISPSSPDAKNRDGAWKFVAVADPARGAGQVVPDRARPARPYRAAWADPALSGDTFLSTSVSSSRTPSRRRRSRPGSRSPRPSTTRWRRRPSVTHRRPTR